MSMTSMAGSAESARRAKENSDKHKENRKRINDNYYNAVNQRKESNFFKETAEKNSLEKTIKDVTKYENFTHFSADNYKSLVMELDNNISFSVDCAKDNKLKILESKLHDLRKMSNNLVRDVENYGLHDNKERYVKHIKNYATNIKKFYYREIEFLSGDSLRSRLI